MKKARVSPVAKTVDNNYGLNVDVRDIVKGVEIREETLMRDIIEQPNLLLAASYYRIQKMRTRMQAESSYEQIKVATSIKARQRVQIKATEASIRETVEFDHDVIEALAKYEHAKISEEWAKALVDAYQMRGSMCKALVQLVGAEASLNSSHIRAELERMGLNRITENLQRRYPGEDV